MAAGTGTRVGHEVNKVYLPLRGRPAVAWSLESALRVPQVSRVVLVAAERDHSLAAQALACDAPRQVVEVVTGGSTRHASEWNGLQALSAEIRRGDLDIVVIHDAARPLASTALFAEVIATAWAHGGAVPVRPHTAVVRVDGAALAPREDIVAVQTPQAFAARPLLAAYHRADREGFTGSDTASCVENFSDLSVRYVTGSAHNIKITFREDLAIAEYLLNR
jgi:2-C-methyl-D-erythritol 4-phosphate cytidylyltransferase